MNTVVKPLEKLAYSLEETAKVIGLSYNTVKKLIGTGEIPSIRLGEKRILVPADGLRACLNKEQNDAAKNGRRRTMEQIPDHPDIRKMEMYGTLNPEDDFIPKCPVCGEECETLYQDCNREIVGCDNCVEHFDAYDYLWEKMEEERADDEE